MQNPDHNSVRSQSGHLVIAHVGLGKCATSFLQTHVFPVVAEQLNLSFSTDGRNHLPIQHRVFLSNESLASETWDPFFFEAELHNNVAYLGADAHIILTLRSPNSFLRSVFVQQLHRGFVLEPSDFFLDGKRYQDGVRRGVARHLIWSAELFSYSRLIEMYRSAFSRVTVVKYENLAMFSFVEQLLLLYGNLESAQIRTLQLEFAKKLRAISMNRGYSQNAVKLTFWFNSALKRIGSNIQNYESFLRKCLEPLETTSSHRLRAHILRELGWRHFLQNRFDRFWPYTQFELDFIDLPALDIKKLEREYAAIDTSGTYLANNS